ncbi:MAG: sigma-54 dependent transcriptional regulator [Syntrophales bacterium]|nr:sigma-54 dependent transcriptional regulator [Syntrophales bacterium]
MKNNLDPKLYDSKRFSPKSSWEAPPYFHNLIVPQGLSSFVVYDPYMEDLMSVVKMAGSTNVNVLICGESGTGKSTLARIIHHLSPRSDGPLVEVNCGALAETLLESELFGHVRGAFTGAIRDKVGKFEKAHEGTIFLDDINSASLGMQTKLLRVIEDGIIERVGANGPIKVDVRIISATNKELLTEVDNGRFREDLFYRINVVCLKIPPLVQRKSEIPYLIDFFISKYNLLHHKNVKGIVNESLAKALSYSWPGNVRELENTVERAVVLCNSNFICLDLDNLYKDDLQKNSSISKPLSQCIQEYEKELLLKALKEYRWDVKAVSKHLSIGRSTLFNKIKKYCIVKSFT